MTDLPISFSPPMVRALPDGRKKMTRRVLKPQPFSDGFFEGEIDCTFVPAFAGQDAFWRFGATAVGGGAIRTEAVVPRYAVGDRLYVREPWQALAEYDHLSPKDIPVGSDILYIADREDSPWDARRRLARFMCKWMSRITLAVTDVRVERLQDISEADAIAEGAPLPRYGVWPFVDERRGLTGQATSARAWFAMLWDSLHGPGAWEANPWVAAISFTRSMGNIDE